MWKVIVRFHFFPFQIHFSHPPLLQNHRLGRAPRHRKHHAAVAGAGVPNHVLLPLHETPCQKRRDPRDPGNGKGEACSSPSSLRFPLFSALRLLPQNWTFLAFSPHVLPNFLMQWMVLKRQHFTEPSRGLSTGSICISKDTAGPQSLPWGPRL